MTTDKSKRPKVGIGVIVTHQNKVLIGKRLNELGKNSWAFPGGHLEYEETWEECAIRETLEETNLKVKNPQFVAATNDIFQNQEKHYITLFIQAEYESGELKVMEPDKCQEWQWFEWDKLPQNLFLSIQNLLKQNFNPFK